MSPNGFCSVYALMHSLYSVLGHNGFYSVYRRICFSEWHIVPQLCIQLKLSRVYSRKALAGCKASRRLGKQMRGFSGFCLKPTLLHHLPNKFQPLSLQIAKDFGVRPYFAS